MFLPLHSTAKGETFQTFLIFELEFFEKTDGEANPIL